MNLVWVYVTPAPTKQNGVLEYTELGGSGSRSRARQCESALMFNTQNASFESWRAVEKHPKILVVHGGPFLRAARAQPV